MSRGLREKPNKGLIRTIGWAFLLFLHVLLGSGLGDQALAQHREATHASGHGHDPASPATPAAPKWEGSPEGIAYSERNHRLAGMFVLVIALTELREAFAWTRFAWSRFLLPTALLGAGGFLLIWSDHEAWPIGSLSFTDTFFGHDQEILQHKLYGLLLLAVGAVESLRRSGRLAHRAWLIPLPLFAIVGGLMLFVHSHGDHPSAQTIAFHHALMGAMAVLAGAGKLVSIRILPDGEAGRSRWNLLWGGLILLIGIQLVLYSE